MNNILMNTVPENPTLVQQLVRDLRANLQIADKALSNVREEAAGSRPRRAGRNVDPQIARPQGPAGPRGVSA